MRSGRKKYELSDWRLTMEQIGRELGKICQRPQRLPRRLRLVLTEFEKSEMPPFERLTCKTEAKGPDRIKARSTQRWVVGRCDCLFTPEV